MYRGRSGSWLTISAVLVLLVSINEALVYPPTYSIPPTYSPTPTPSPSATLNLPNLTNVRLVNGTTDTTAAGVGRLEVFHLNTWGTVCDDSFSDVDANVVCKQLGFKSGHTTNSSRYGSADGIVWMAGVSCLGNESTLQNCSFGGWGLNVCSHAQDVAIVCAAEAAVEIKPILLQMTGKIPNCSIVNAFQAEEEAYLHRAFCSSGKCAVSGKSFVCVDSSGRRRLLADSQFYAEYSIEPSGGATLTEFAAIAALMNSAISSGELVPAALASKYGVTNVQARVVDPNGLTPSSKKDDKTGMIVGAVIGSVAGFAIIAGVATYFYIRARRHQRIANKQMLAAPAPA